MCHMAINSQSLFAMYKTPAYWRLLKICTNIFTHWFEIANLTLQFLVNNAIDVKNCRGQSYDNPSNISGKYNGVQPIIREKCDVALYVPCTAYLFNWVVSCAAECYPTYVSFLIPFRTFILRLLHLPIVDIYTTSTWVDCCIYPSLTYKKYLLLKLCQRPDGPLHMMLLRL